MRKNQPDRRPNQEARPQRRVLARVLAEDLTQVGAGTHEDPNNIHTFTRCPYPCDFDVD